MNYYKELPAGYTLKKTINATDKKIGILLNIIAILISMVIWVSFYFIRCKDYAFWKINDTNEALYLFICALSIFAYLVLHELTHGLMYKLFTHEKLTFGFSWSCAYCGVPKLYTTKKTALFSVLAPFVLYNILFLILLFILPLPFAFYVLVLFGLHFGGCVGDLYVTILLLKYPKGTLMNDTGPKQEFYIPTESIA